MIAGRPAYVIYSGPGPNHNDLFPVTVWVYDAATETEYRLIGKDSSLRGGPPAPLIAIARSLFEPPNPLPPQTTFRYDSYDTSGEVAEPGSYAFLADAGEAASAVTTYEGLRDGSARALRIHETDADGVSRAAFLDTVEAGDLFEWRQAEDCFVRYKVTELSSRTRLGDRASQAARRRVDDLRVHGLQRGDPGEQPLLTVDWAIPSEHGQSPEHHCAYPIHGALADWSPDDWTGATHEGLQF